MSKVKTPIYLDYQATTPLDPRALKAMQPYLKDRFGNPHSVDHRFGWEAEAAVSVAREQVAAVIGARPEEIIFTSGATESNNLALKGVMQAYGSKRRHLVSVVSEHKCVLESAQAIARWGFELTILPIQPDGLVDPERLADALREDTALVSVMAVNNEIGVMQPLAEIGRITRQRGVLFHSDAAQAFGKVPLDVEAMNIDLMSLSGHKIYGPKGVGALYVRQRPPVRLVPQMDGGGQEAGLRSGTLSPALVVGFGTAARIAMESQDAETRQISQLSRVFRQTLQAAIPDLGINGSLEQRYLGNLNLTFPGINGDLLLAELRDLSMSSGAACASASEGPSYVLEALGLSEELAQSSLRIGIGRFTTADELEYAAGRIIEVVAKLRPAGT
ncbi:MAG: aminotransferase class V-fold PLP-dependent enzyme [Proteobacteria bacterium]|nr:aminotransferase class V-fold PLP-dependent enzyme [Pseudomonadota bacterium]